MLTASALEKAQYLICTPAGFALRWQKWDEVYLVYQASSAETHVFNDTTALILRCLEAGPRSAEESRSGPKPPSASPGELGADDFAFATQRLEELGLIEYLDEILAPQ